MTLLPGRRDDQGRRAGPRGAARAAHRGQGREHGRVLHHPRRADRVPRRPGPGRARAHRRHRPAPSVGAHDGVRAFTVGQRRGLAVATGERRYVVDVDAATATVTLGGADDLRRDGVDLDRGRRSPGPPIATARRCRRAGARRTARRSPAPGAGIASSGTRRSRGSLRARRSRCYDGDACSAPASPADRASGRRVGRAQSCRTGMRRAPARGRAGGAHRSGRRGSARRGRATPCLRDRRMSGASSWRRRAHGAEGGAEPEVEASAGGRRPGRPGPRPWISSRRNSTGSVSVSGSAMTRPAGTSTTQRRESWWTSRPTTHGQRPADRHRDAAAPRARRRAGAGRRRCRADERRSRRAAIDERERGRHLQREAFLVAVGRALRAHPGEVAAHGRARTRRTVTTIASDPGHRRRVAGRPRPRRRRRPRSGCRAG